MSALISRPGCRNALLNVLLTAAAAAAAALSCEMAARSACRGVIQEMPPGPGSFARDFGRYAYKRDLAQRLGDPELLEFSFIQNLYWQFEAFRRGPVAPESRRARRALFLGDSVLYGSGVDPEKIFTSLLRGRMPDWDIVNLGVPGFNIYQIHSIFTWYYPIVRPDALVYVWCGNDIQPALSVRRWRAEALLYPGYLFDTTAAGRLRLLPPMPMGLRLLLMRSSLYKIWLISWLPDRGFVDGVRKNEVFTRLSNLLISDMARRCRQDGVPMLIVYPENSTLDPSAIAPMPRAAGCEYLFLPLAPGYFLPDGSHLNEEGHRKVARLLRERGFAAERGRGQFMLKSSGERRAGGA